MYHNGYHLITSDERNWQTYDPHNFIRYFLFIVVWKGVKQILRCSHCLLSFLPGCLSSSLSPSFPQCDCLTLDQRMGPTEFPIDLYIATFATHNCLFSLHPLWFKVKQLPSIIKLDKWSFFLHSNHNYSDYPFLVRFLFWYCH